MQPARVRNGQRAFLLVEAMVATVMIAVGLVFVSRGISSSLKALSNIQQYDQLLRLAESTLSTRAAQLQHMPEPTPMGEIFEPPYEAYQWVLESVPLFQAPEGIDPDALHTVTLTISRVDERPPIYRLTTIWPKDWVVPEFE